MTQQDNYIARQSPDSIRSEVFSHRMRGLDEDEVRDYLEMLAAQVQAADAEVARQRAEIEGLRNENRVLRTELEAGSTEITPQAVALFSQAQQVADQLVEEAVVHARDLMMSARMQQRDILERARQAAEEAARNAGGAAVEAFAEVRSSGGYSTPIPEVEYVRTFARVAQVQLRSVLEALGEHVDRLGQLPQLDADNPLGDHRIEPQTLSVPHSRTR